MKKLIEVISSKEISSKVRFKNEVVSTQVISNDIISSEVILTEVISSKIISEEIDINIFNSSLRGSGDQFR